jgi:hypothetical protein
MSTWANVGGAAVSTPHEHHNEVASSWYCPVAASVFAWNGKRPANDQSRVGMANRIALRPGTGFLRGYLHAGLP